jgi:hypothetical protein
MLEPLVDAFNRQDYDTAAHVLQHLKQQFPDHPWLIFYTARLHEALHEWPQADVMYRQMLRETTNPKIALQARQGLERLDLLAQEQRQQAIQNATAEPSGSKPGFLVLESLSPEQKNAVIPAFSRLMKLDLYTARVHLSHRGWRLYRCSSIGELEFYIQALRRANIPAFAVGLEAIRSIRVFRVLFLRSLNPKAVVICQNESNQAGSLDFEWSEVSAQVSGLLPLLEQVVDLGPWNRLKRKEATQDYAQIYDLHLPKRNCILRFCDRTYDFKKGIALRPQSEDLTTSQTTIRLNWEALLSQLRRNLNEIPHYCEFAPFAESAFEHIAQFNSLNTHIQLFQQEQALWDRAFHIYSSAAFLKRP